MSKLLLICCVLATALVIVPVTESPTADAQANAWFAQVAVVNDGDTVEVLWNQGDAQPPGLSNRIRFVGVDTNEVTSDECFANAARDFVAARIPAGTVVRLEARDINSNASNRPLRHVFYGPNFQHNLSEELLMAGLGLAASYDDEPDYRDDYFEAVEQAYVNKVGMWSQGSCGTSGTSFADLDVHVNWDAPGSDNSNVNGEYIQIRNNGSSALTMNGWTFRSSARTSGNTLVIPDGTRVPAGGKLRIRMGSGNNTTSTIYMGQTNGWFDNDTDIFYLRDQHLNLRAFQVWPCSVSCEPSGTVVVEAVSFDPPGDDNLALNDEWVRVRNVGNGSVDMTDWKLQDNGTDYHFADGKVLAEGQALTVRVGSGQDTSTTAYWGNSASILANAGDALWVFDGRHVPVDCYSYGSAVCHDEPVRGAVQLTAQYDAKGSDAKHPNREWVALENTSDERVNIAGHTVRVGQHNYTFPSGTRIEPGKRLRLRVGSGSNTTANHYWGHSSGIMANSAGAVQLLDKDNHVLREHRWPCADCGPDGPFVIDRVKYNAKGRDRTNPNGEWIRIRNASSERASLRDYMVKVGKKQYVFVTNVWLNPGKTVRIRVGKGSDTSKNVYWGRGRDILRNKGKRVSLYSPFRELVDCHAWGSARCPSGAQGASAGIKISVHADAAGDDAVNQNDEWVDFRNNSSTAISLAGFSLYSDGETYKFGPNDNIPPGKRLRVRSGNGTDSGLTRYAGTDLQELSNVHDEVELRDGDGRMAKFFSY